MTSFLELGDVEVERFFNYACIWSFGGTMSAESRESFSGWWKEKFNDRVDYPEDGSVSTVHTFNSDLIYSLILY